MNKSLISTKFKKRFQVNVKNNNYNTKYVIIIKNNISTVVTIATVFNVGFVTNDT